MLRPNQIDRVIAAARRARANLPISIMPVRVAPPVARRAVLRPSFVQNCPGAASVTRRAMVVVANTPPPAPSPTPCPTVTTDPNATPTPVPTVTPTATPTLAPSGTGITAWWTYNSTSVPGGETGLVNVGTGNFLLQDDDMNVAHKGVAMSLRRTYNSQSLHDVAGTDGAQPNMFGNGWTNTFDAHLAGLPTSGTMSVYDVDGARYDYTGSNAGWTPPAGQHATLVSDGHCSYLWTKQDGTTFYIFGTAEDPVMCPGAWAKSGGLAGRLHQIIGRNRNTYLTLNYSWDGGISSPAGKVSQITVRSESGLTATLAFADVGGHRLLQQITFPDGVTTVSYGYDGQGNLTAVSHPANDAAGDRPLQGYGYQAIGSSQIMYWDASPRWNFAGQYGAGWGADGGWLIFGFAGGSPRTSTLSAIVHSAVVNGPVPDGTNTVLQPAFASGATNYLIEYYTTGAPTATLRDTDGHATTWILDGRARPTQVQVAADATTLVSNLSWDASNNLVTVVDPRGHRKDAAYDAAGNVVALAEPQVNENGAVYRPTRLFDYDAYSNLVAYCDQNLTHGNGGDWNGQYSGQSDSYCASLPGGASHTRFVYATPAPDASGNSSEPNGELVSVTMPSGYTRTVAYDAASQGGTDYGLPTHVSGTGFTQQLDSTNRQPSDFRTYDAHGNVICDRIDGGTNASTTVIRYDALNRVVDVADPDDASVPAACPKTPGLNGSTVVTHTTYYPSGAVATTQTPSQAAANAVTTYGYDHDDNPSTVTPSGSPAIMTSWYDGAGRLVETMQPADPNTTGDYPILLRYIYDLSQGGSAPTLSGTSVVAHGNLYEVQKNSPSGWIDFQYGAFDSANHMNVRYAFAPCPMVFDTTTMNQTVYGAIWCSPPAFATTFNWKGSPGPGLLASVTDALGFERDYSYDADDRVVSAGYSATTTTAALASIANPTPPTSYVYDPNGRVSIGSSSAGTFTYNYAPDGQLTNVHNDTLGTTTGYQYYPDGKLLGVSSVTPSLVNQPNLYQYSYRYDGLLQRETFGASNQSVSFYYTSAGRPTAMGDALASPTEARSYDAHARMNWYTTPAGAYSVSSFDAMGRIVGYTATDGETVASQYNVRGDLVARTFQPNPTNASTGRPSYPSFQYSNIHGVLVHSNTDQYDGRTGAPLIVNGFALTYDTIGRVSKTGLGNTVKTYTYDAEDRLVQGDAAGVLNPAPCLAGTGLGGPGGTEVSYAYDAEGNVTQDVFNDKNGQNVRRWYWDRGIELYTSTAYAGGTSTLDNFQADTLGVIPANGTSPGLTISDYDLDGVEVLHHNVTGHSAWRENNPFVPGCVSVNSVAASTGYVEPSITVPNSGADDGTAVTSIGRGVLGRANGFTTPDYSSQTPYASTRSPQEGQGGNTQIFPCLQGFHWTPKEGGYCEPDGAFPVVLPCASCVPAQVPTRGNGANNNPINKRHPNWHTPNPKTKECEDALKEQQKISQDTFMSAVVDGTGLGTLIWMYDISKATDALRPRRTASPATKAAGLAKLGGWFGAAKDLYQGGRDLGNVQSKVDSACAGQGAGAYPYGMD